MPPLRIGMIGLDTSHVPGFAQLLNDPHYEHHVPGGRIVAAFPGGSPDFELSWSRVDGYAAELRDKYDVQILDSPEAVADAVDLVFIMSVDGRVHLDQFRRIVRFQKPTFIDKPLATNSRDAAEIFRLAEEGNVAVMSASSLRYADPLVDALADAEDPILGCDAFGPVRVESTQGGLFFYGIHGIEIVVRVMGAGCSGVRALPTTHADLVAFAYPDGRAATFHGLRNGTTDFGVTLHRQRSGPRFLSLNPTSRPRYAGLLAAIMRSLPQGKSDVTPAETLEVIRLIEWANAGGMG